MKFFKILFYNLTILFSFILIIELFFGYWFDKDNFGPYMREHRMKNQRIEWSDDNEKITYFYRRNYHGFRGGDIKPAEIEAIIMGGSVIDERYKPEKYTITGYLSKELEKDFNMQLINAGVEAQSTRGMILGLKNWLFKLKDFSPKFIFFYVGLNDIPLKETDNLENIVSDGHLINPNKKEVLLDNIKSRSILYDTARIFKFKYLPRKGFVKYDGKLSEKYKKNYNFIDYEFAKKNYNIEQLKKKYNLKIKNYLNRIEKLKNLSVDINSIPVFITNIDSWGFIEEVYILNLELMTYCKKKQYNCIDMARKINGNINLWRDGTHTTKKGSELFAKEIYIELKKIVSKYN